jgi:hypothetical protein
LALNDVFPAAETANNIAHLQLHEAVALGAGGPTQATIHAYDAYQGGIPIKLQSGFVYAGVPVLLTFMIVVPFVFLAAAIAAPHKKNANWRRIPACAGAHQRVGTFFSRKLP